MTIPSPTSPETPAGRGRRTRSARWLVALAMLASLAPVAYWGYWRYHLKRFAVVRPGVIYRTGQPTEFGLERVRDRLGVRTVLTLRTDEAKLYRGLLDGGLPDGQRESQFVPALGLSFVQWPMGEETYWPWVTPWQFEEFYKLFDEPENCPVLVHCVGGRHRTGTISALYRLEYDRWSPDRAIAEMMSFDFGPSVAIHDHNLRTYWPRPLPDPEELKSLASLSKPAGSHTNDAYALFRELKSTCASPNSSAFLKLAEYVESGRPFSLCLAARIIDSPQHPLAPVALKLAAKQLERGDASLTTYAAAAALIADFGSQELQQRLLDLLRQERHDGGPSTRYQGLVVGVTNRYTANRVAYLEPLLTDVRQRAEPAKQYRYCDSAAARLMSIVDEPFLQGGSPVADWNDCVSRAKSWLAAHPERATLSQLIPPEQGGNPRTPQLAAPADRDERRR